MLLSLVFSFWNEEGNILELISRTRAAIPSEDDYEFIFVNDQSTDTSLEILLREQKNDPRIKIIDMARNFGVGPCVIAGMTYSTGDAVIYMDSDLQDPPELIPELVAKFKEGYDVVHTTRTHRDGESFLKMWVTKRAYRFINRFADIHLPENTGDFKLLSRKVIDYLIQLPEADPYIRGLSIWVGYKQAFVLYRREARFQGETHFPLFSKGPVREFFRGLTSFSASPLYFSLSLGLVTSFFAVLLGIYAITTKYLGLATSGVSSILVTISFFSGMILITNGILGLYVARIFNEVKQRPRFIVKEALGFEDNIPKKTNSLENFGK